MRTEEDFFTLSFRGHGQSERLKAGPGMVSPRGTLELSNEVDPTEY